MLAPLQDVVFVQAAKLGPLVAARSGSSSEFFTALLIILGVIVGLVLAVKALLLIEELLGMSKKAVLYEKKARIAQVGLKLLKGESTLRDSPITQAYADFFYLRDLDTAFDLHTK
jgi:hypothetical protein